MDVCLTGTYNFKMSHPYCRNEYKPILNIYFYVSQLNGNGYVEVAETCISKLYSQQNGDATSYLLGTLIAGQAPSRSS
jgi:hypothetical protein